MTERSMQVPRARFFTAILVLAAAAPAVAGDKLAVKAGAVWTMAGEPIENGIVLIEGGKVTAVGSPEAVQIPWDAVVLDVPELVAAAGWVEAHTSNGTDRANESIDVAPYLDVRDSIDPVSFYFEDCVRSGITTINVQQGNETVIAGVGMIVKPKGLTVEEMLVRPRSGIKMSAAPKNNKSRATQAQELRNAFATLRRHLEQLVQEKRDGNDRARREALYQGRDLSGERGKGRAMTGKAWVVEGLELVPRGEIDEKQEPLLDVVEGNLPVYFSCEAPMDVRLALEIARDNGFLHRTTLVLRAACWKAADLIAEAGVPVVLDPTLVHTEKDPISEEEIETFVPGVFADKGVSFALSSSNATNESLWFQVATCVAHGMSRAQALAAATTAPAKMLGLEGRVGALTAGADGNVVLYDGDPLSVRSFVQYVVIDGQVVYDRSKDVRTKHLLEGVQPENTESAPDGGAAAAGSGPGEARR